MKRNLFFTCINFTLLNAIIIPSCSTYTSEESNDNPKTIYSAVNTILGENESSHMHQKHTFNAPNNNVHCDSSAGCPLPTSGVKNELDLQNIDSLYTHTIGTKENTKNLDNPNINGVGQMDIRTGAVEYGSALQPPTGNFRYESNPSLYTPSQLGPAFPQLSLPPQRGSLATCYPPSPRCSLSHYNHQETYNQPPYNLPPYNLAPYNFSPYIQPSYNQPPHQGHATYYTPYGFHGAVFPMSAANTISQYPDPSYGHKNNQHYDAHARVHGHNSLDHSLKSKTEYTEVGHHEIDGSSYNGYNNGMELGTHFDGTYNGIFNRPGY